MHLKMKDSLDVGQKRMGTAMSKQFNLYCGVRSKALLLTRRKYHLSEYRNRKFIYFYFIIIIFY